MRLDPILLSLHVLSAPLLPARNISRAVAKIRASNYHDTLLYLVLQLTTHIRLIFLFGVKLHSFFLHLTYSLIR